jgi:predicted O-linked N-acetylglucosamine transferase (SPINDLY family)
MWMGVPVVTLAGGTHASRVGASLLGAAGLTELVAKSPDEFVSIAAGLGKDPARLSALRGELRGRLRESPLLDGANLARRLEGAYRVMWQKWCEGSGAML